MTDRNPHPTPSACDKQLIAEGACLLERFAKKERAKGKIRIAAAAERSAQAIRRAHALHQVAVLSAEEATAPLSLGSTIGAIPLAEAIQRAHGTPASV